MYQFVLFDVANIYRFWDVFKNGNQLTEIRLIANDGKTASGYFTNPQTMIEAVRPYAKDYSGGIVGLNEKDVLSCVNYGLIIAEGGICGMNNGTISECTNYGNVSTGNHYAGICGSQKDGIISKCINYGPIGFKSSSSTYIAGICGDMENGTITNCLNAGLINQKHK